MKEIVITIPQALREGQKIRLRGMGAEGKEGGEPGDLYLKVKFRKPLLQKVRIIKEFKFFSQLVGRRMSRIRGFKDSRVCFLKIL